MTLALLFGVTYIPLAAVDNAAAAAAAVVSLRRKTATTGACFQPPVVCIIKTSQKQSVNALLTDFSSFGSFFLNILGSA